MTNKLLALAITEKDDLSTLFQFQLDEEAGYLAAFMAKDSADEVAYTKKYVKFLADPAIHMRTIRIDNKIVGSIAKFIIGSTAEITYWIDKKFWGQGVATTALKEFLMMEKSRPIYGRVAFDNYGSQRVLEKGGFIRIGKDNGFANARKAEIEEYIYELSS